ncbi:MAG: hypothetical protein J6W96_01990 [Alphaproteobacteria bacterium]|nr:hypothetical protein [Alphaproteobacteria bacterium]
MNYKTMLMASAAVLFASQAMAQDLTGAFSVPGKGQIMSDTSVAMGRQKYEVKGAWSEAYDSLVAGEVLEYGITDKFSVNAGISNTFDVEGEYNNDHNFTYNVGAKYNTRFNDVLFQVAGRYNTLDPKSWYGKKERAKYGLELNDRWTKSLGLDLKAGLDLGNGITPYIVYSIDSEIDQADRALFQSVSLGIHKYAGKWALDGAVRYDWEKHNKWGAKNDTATWLDAEADYYLKDNVALGVYGSYLLDAHDQKVNGWTYHVNRAHEVGLRVKVLF